MENKAKNPPEITCEKVTFNDGQVALFGLLCLPKDATDVVVFAHGWGSSSTSPRNSLVAEKLNKRGIGTLLFDLLTEEERLSYIENVFDIDLLTRRLFTAIEWLSKNSETEHLLVGLSGASTGAAAAMNVAGNIGDSISAVVCRGGRVDLADEKIISKIAAPTLLVVGSLDEEVLSINRSVAKKISCQNKVAVVEGAGHVFEELDTFEVAADLTCDWFEKYLLKKKI